MLPNTLTEMGCQLIIKQRAINAGFQPRGEEMLVKELEHAGCSPASIRLLEPEWTWFAPDPDWPNQPEGTGGKVLCLECAITVESDVEPIILVRAEQSGSFDSREGEELG